MKKLLLIVLLLTAIVGQAQKVRKDDIVLNRDGRPVNHAMVEVCANSTGCIPAQVYSDSSGTPATNVVYSDTYGNYHVYVDPGTYKIRVTVGATVREFPDQSIGTGSGGGGGGGSWGLITGTLSNQGDLQSALDAKAPTQTPTFQGSTSVQGTSNGAILLTVKRFTDMSPTGTFQCFSPASGIGCLWSIDVNGILTNGTVPTSRIPGLATVALSGSFLDLVNAASLVTLTDVQTLQAKTLQTPVFLGNIWTQGTANGATLSIIKRFSDTSPTGFFQIFTPASGVGTLWAVDINGVLTSGGVPMQRISGIPNCNNATTSKLLYDQPSSSFTCGTDQGGGGSGTWGSITGTLSSQTDLQTALNAKAPIQTPVFQGATIVQGTTNGGMLFTLKRFTDSSPLGYFELFSPASGVGSVWSVDINGNATGASVTTNGAGAGSVKFNGSSSGTVTVVAPAAAGTNTLTLPASTGTVVASGTDINASSQVTATHLSAPLPVSQGGTGTTTPGIIAGSGVTVSGTWPNQTIAATGGGGGGSSVGTLFAVNYTNTTTAASVTNFQSPIPNGSANTNEGNHQNVMPAACTLKNLYVTFGSGTQTATGSLDIVVRKNGVDTALKVSVAAGTAATNPMSDTSDTVAVVAGDLISYAIRNNGTATSIATNTISMQCN